MRTILEYLVKRHTSAVRNTNDYKSILQDAFDHIMKNVSENETEYDTMKGLRHTQSHAILKDRRGNIQNWLLIWWFFENYPESTENECISYLKSFENPYKNHGDFNILNIIESMQKHNMIDIINKKINTIEPKHWIKVEN